eukprot:3815-Pelagococcus_subviridis.AAC.4
MMRSIRPLTRSRSFASSRTRPLKSRMFFLIVVAFPGRLYITRCRSLRCSSSDLNLFRLKSTAMRCDATRANGREGRSG